MRFRAIYHEYRRKKGYSIDGSGDTFYSVQKNAEMIVDIGGVDDFMKRSHAKRIIDKMLPADNFAIIAKLEPAQ